MTNETETYGIDVWMCATIYVEAETEEAAAAIVSERYAGTRDKSSTYDHMSSEDLPMEGDDFMSSAVTLYGLASESKLMPTDATGAVYMVESEHFSVPGRVLKLFTSRRAADIEAASLINIMLSDQGWKQTAKPHAWSAEIERLREYHGEEECYVEVSERQLEGGTPAPVRDAAPDMLKVLRRFASVFGENLDDPDEPLNGGDAVDELCKLWPAIKEAIAKAEGGAA